MTDSTTPRILARAPIIFDVADGSSEHAPMIIGAVGGVVTRLGSTVYDGSVTTQLQKMKQALIEAGQ